MQWLPVCFFEPFLPLGSFDCRMLSAPLCRMLSAPFCRMLSAPFCRMLSAPFCRGLRPLCFLRVAWQDASWLRSSWCSCWLSLVSWPWCWLRSVQSLLVEIFLVRKKSWEIISRQFSSTWTSDICGTVMKWRAFASGHLQAFLELGWMFNAG